MDPFFGNGSGNSNGGSNTNSTNNENNSNPNFNFSLNNGIQHPPNVHPSVTPASEQMPIFGGSEMAAQLDLIGEGFGGAPPIAYPPPPVPFPTEKTFKYMNECAISIGNTPSGSATLLIYIKDTPFFGVGSMFNLTAVELTDASLYYNSKRDFLLEEDIDPRSHSPEDLDRDKRLHKLHLYKLPETGEYRIDLVRLAKTGIPEIDALDPWKDYNDMDDDSAGNRLLQQVKNFAPVLKASRNEPDIVITAKIPLEYPELDHSMGVVMFKRVQ